MAIDYLKDLQVIEEYKTRYYEKKFNINTSALETDNKTNREIHFDYAPTLYSVLELLFDKYPFENNDHLVDFGSGKGRVLIFAAENSCPKITGYEIDKIRYLQSIENLENYKKSNKCNSIINIYNEDVTKIALSESTNKFYFFNPFHLKVFIRVFDLILKSYNMKKREILIMLYRPAYSTINYLSEINCIKLIETFDKIDAERPLYAIFKIFDIL